MSYSFVLRYGSTKRTSQLGCRSHACTDTAVVLFHVCLSPTLAHLGRRSPLSPTVKLCIIVRRCSTNATLASPSCVDQSNLDILPRLYELRPIVQHLERPMCDDRLGVRQAHQQSKNCEQPFIADQVCAFDFKGKRWTNA